MSLQIWDVTAIDGVAPFAKGTIKQLFNAMRAPNKTVTLVATPSGLEVARYNSSLATPSGFTASAVASGFNNHGFASWTVTGSSDIAAILGNAQFHVNYVLRLLRLYFGESGTVISGNVIFVGSHPDIAALTGSLEGETKLVLSRHDSSYVPHPRPVRMAFER